MGVRVCVCRADVRVLLFGGKGVDQVGAKVLRADAGEGDHAGLAHTPEQHHTFRQTGLTMFPFCSPHPIFFLPALPLAPTPHAPSHLSELSPLARAGT